MHARFSRNGKTPLEKHTLIKFAIIGEMTGLATFKSLSGHWSILVFFIFIELIISETSKLVTGDKYIELSFRTKYDSGSVDVIGKLSLRFVATLLK